jgi:hypothetical protein
LGENEHGREDSGWGRKEEKEPVIFHLPVAWQVISMLLVCRDAVKSGASPDYNLHCKNLLIPGSCESYCIPLVQIPALW